MVVGIIEAVLFYPPIWQVLVIGFLASLVVAMVSVWFERKTAARVQRRIGPLWASPRMGGFMHAMADMVRYAFQQVIIPSTADRIPYLVAPVVGLVIVVLPIAFVPLTTNPAYWPVPLVEYSVILALAAITLPPIFLIIAGWASNNKFSVIGGVREAFIITAYELIFIISVLSAAAMAGSLSFLDAVSAQGYLKWFIILNPLAFLAAYVSVMMSTSAFPFEIPESEPEVVAGPFTEYSGILYALNMGGAYLRRFVMNIVLALAFLGGWYPLVPGEGVIAGYLLPSLVVVAKAFLLTLTMSFFRAIYGRYRLDQALDMAWKILFPLALLGLGVGIIESYLGIV